jgi:AmmeMemoRadiSam system protein A
MPSLSEAECQALLRLARESVVEAVCRNCLPKRIPSDGIFAGHGGVFVTLHVSHKLRGCIGVVEANEPLGGSIVRCAASAALQDTRFAPVRPEELAELQIEVSLLSKRGPITLEQIEIGRHGLLVTCGNQRGVLLPQVAGEHRLTPEQFLAEACRKAGLAPEAWRNPGVEVFGFTCDVLAEAEKSKSQADWVL